MNELWHSTFCFASPKKVLYNNYNICNLYYRYIYRQYIFYAGSFLYWHGVAVLGGSSNSLGSKPNLSKSKKEDPDMENTPRPWLVPPVVMCWEPCNTGKLCAYNWNQPDLHEQCVEHDCDVKYVWPLPEEGVVDNIESLLWNPSNSSKILFLFRVGFCQ